MTVPLFREHEQRSAEHVACDAYYASGMYRMSVPPRGEDVARVVVGALAEAGLLRERNELEACLRKIEQWDMLSLTPEGKGAASPDAPYFRNLIAAALKAER